MQTNMRTNLDNLTCSPSSCNQDIGFADKMNMLKSIYEVAKKSKKWQHGIFRYFMDVSLVIIFRSISNVKSLTPKMFRLAVINGLIGTDTDVSKRGDKKLIVLPPPKVARPQRRSCIQRTYIMQNYQFLKGFHF